jgi:hypothetical protein
VQAFAFNQSNQGLKLENSCKLNYNQKEKKVGKLVAFDVPRIALS